MKNSKESGETRLKTDEFPYKIYCRQNDLFIISKTMILCPYKYKCDWFIKISRLYFCTIAVTLAIRVAL